MDMVSPSGCALLVSAGGAVNRLGGDVNPEELGVVGAGVSARERQRA
ncbi:hypothetical protein [Mycolicibacterium peregrinum]